MAVTGGRLGLSVAPDGNSGQEPLGLQVIHGPEDAGGDIVFVHGLGGSAWRTWCWKREIHNFWPQWLVEEEPFSSYRISTFGYNARFKGEGTNLNIIDFAKDLLLQLYTTLGHSGSTATPIILVAHSMGGLVVKKAYMLGKHDKHFSSLIKRVLGIIFLATPHRGTQHAKVLNNILSAAPLGAPPKAYVSDLERQSTSISDINESFRQGCEELLLVSFYETLKTNLHLSKILIVEKDSAVLGYPHEVSAPMDADHHTICKFRDRSDPNYIKVRALLKTWLLHEMEPGRPSLPLRESTYLMVLRRAQSILGMHGSGDSNNDLAALKALLVGGSGRWLMEKNEFKGWLNRDVQDDRAPLIFWLIGLPGKGKTVLSAGVTDYVQSTKHQVQYHMFNQGHRVRRSISYCLRSIAAQVAEQIPVFRKALVGFYEETGISFKSEEQTFQYLWEKIFVGILFKLQLVTPLWWVLDGIDESDNPSVLVASLSAIHACTPIKIYMSSRPLKYVSLVDKTRLTTYLLQDADTAQDIRAYTLIAVRTEIPDDSALQRDVNDKILGNAMGSFLWVRLALETLENNWHTRETIETALRSVPLGMVAMYERMVHNINIQQPRIREMAKLILAWTSCSWRPLTFEELEAALHPEFKDFTNLVITVNQVCGHFIHVEQSSKATSVVSLIHDTTRDFLLNGGDSTVPYIDAKEAHKTMAIHCLSYLASKRWRRHFSSLYLNISIGRNEDGGTIVLDDGTCPLLTYATRYWAYHVSRAPVDATDLLKALHTFLNNYCLIWIEGLALAGNVRYVSRAAQYLKAYVERGMRTRSATGGTEHRPSLKDSPSDMDWVRAWAVDLIRVVGKFGSNLVRNPPSIHKHVPAFCPKDSMIGKAYRSSPSCSLAVGGSTAETWDDCLASVNIGGDESASQVLATEAFFITLANASGTVVLCSTETCAKVRTISHREWIRLMAVNRSGTLLATSGYRTFCVWEISSGRRVHSFPKTSEAMVRDLKFSSDDQQLLIGLDNCTVAYLDFRSGKIETVFTAQLPETESGYFGCPGNVVISPDLSKAAMSWRGKAPLVWDLNHADSMNPYTCRRLGFSNPLLNPKRLLWHPESGYLLVLCSTMRLVEWHILDDYQVEYDHIGACDISVSDDGKFMLSQDHQGTISIWTFPQYNLVYRLLNINEPSSAMAFSPDSHRFYEVRGSVCNVWAPDALVRANEDDLEDHSSSVESMAVTEPITSAASCDQILITAMSFTSNAKYFSCGREDGSVIIVDSHTGKRLRKVYNHSSPGDVVVLSWSPSGKYIVSCDELGQVIVKRLQLKEEGRWAVFAVFETNLKENALQLLFSRDEKLLLISTPSEDLIWDTKLKQQIQARDWVSSQSRYWSQHPSSAGELVWVEPSLIRTYKWSSLEQQKQVRTAPRSSDAPGDANSREGRSFAAKPPTPRQPSRQHHGNQAARAAAAAQSNGLHQSKRRIRSCFSTLLCPKSAACIGHLTYPRVV
jgi:WD40 repeat protein/pimeloyl-ACP methyl ester carboxylesterase